MMATRLRPIMSNLTSILPHRGIMDHSQSVGCLAQSALRLPASDADGDASALAPPTGTQERREADGRWKSGASIRATLKSTPLALAGGTRSLRDGLRRRPFLGSAARGHRVDDDERHAAHVAM